MNEGTYSLLEVAMKPNPAGTPRNPFHVFLFVITFLNGLTLALGFETSFVIDEVMDNPYIHVYGMLLSASTGAVLAGMYWPGDPRVGLIYKRLGYFGLFCSTLIYAVGVEVAVGRRGTLQASTTAIFALICLRQWWTLSKQVKRAVDGKPIDTTHGDL